MNLKCGLFTGSPLGIISSNQILVSLINVEVFVFEVKLGGSRAVTYLLTNSGSYFPCCIKKG
ncbi:MAG: hypothetical protein QXJ17_06480 [Nitrososphaeria archaeon]